MSARPETLGTATDAWGNVARTGTCEAMRGLGRTMWTLCGKPAKGVIVQRDGWCRYACGAHLAGARRQRSAGYSRDAVELRALDGVTVTDTWVNAGPARGYFAPVDG